jgi:dipeptide/tripeptide permease
MKPSPIQLAFGYIGAILQMIVVFHTPLGISDTLSGVLQVVALGCLAGFFVIHYHRRKAAVSAGTPLVTATPTQQRRTTWIVIVILVVGTLSGPFWLPYTGVVLPFPLLVVTSVISCLFSLAVYFIARRVMKPKT